MATSETPKVCTNTKGKVISRHNPPGARGKVKDDDRPFTERDIVDGHGTWEPDNPVIYCIREVDGKAEDLKRP